MTAADVAIQFAVSQVGKPYQWGATGPDAYDCSGLVQASFKAAGISLPRVSQMQMLVGTPVTLQNLMPGDLCFPDSGHVQIYTGQGSIVEAPSSGLTVRVTKMWGQDYPGWTARRVTAPGSVNGGINSAVYTSTDTTAQTVSNPITSALSGLTGLFDAVWGAIKWPANPANWLRVAEFIGGLLLLLVGLNMFGGSGAVKTLTQQGVSAFSKLKTVPA